MSKNQDDPITMKPIVDAIVLVQGQVSGSPIFDPDPERRIRIMNALEELRKAAELLCVAEGRKVFVFEGKPGA